MSNTKLVEALRKAFTGYEANDKGPLLELIGDDFVFEMSDAMPYGGRYVGREDFKAFWAAVGAQWTYFRYDAHAIVDAGDTVVVPVLTDALSLSGIPMRNEHLFLFEVREGRLVYGRLYADTARGRDIIVEGHAPRRFERAPQA